MNKRTLPILFVTAMLFILSLAGVSAAVSLPWTNSFNEACDAEWEWPANNGHPPCYPTYDRYLDTDCSGGEGEQITTNANMAAGAGGRGQRHWEGDGINNNSGGLGLSFNNTQTELWFRWYMRYQSGFQWSSLNYDKLLYFNVGQNSQFVAEFKGSDGLRIGAQHSQYFADCFSSCGWATVMGGTTSDGLWHCYEIHVKMDTNGSNGIAQFWIDEILYIDDSTFDFSTQSGWNYVQIGSNQRTPNNSGCEAVDFDDIAVSNTGYIGPISTTCGDGTCDPGETCLADSCCNGVTYNTATQVCCSGTIYSGDCCDDSDCISPETCINHQCTSQTADLNQDGSVNSIDFGIMMSYWGYTSYPSADINQDGYVNTVDFGIMMSQWG